MTSTVWQWPRDPHQPGRMTSHAALSPGEWAYSCICGCEALRIDVDAKEFTVDGVTVKEGI